MSDQVTQQVSGQQDISQPQGEIMAQVGPAPPVSSIKEFISEATSRTEEPANNRLLLYEVLLDEYETLAHPQLHPTVRQQIEKAIKDIRKDGDDFKEKWEKLS